MQNDRLKIVQEVVSLPRDIDTFPMKPTLQYKSVQ